MDEFLRVLSARRRRIRIQRVARTALRGAFYATTAGALAVAALRFAGMTLPLALGAAALATLPVVLALREALRAFTLRDCAIHLDRLLGLEERLTTAIEAPGAMGQLVMRDAAGALTRTPMPPRSLPREGKLLAVSALLLATFLALPSPDRSGAKGDVALEALLSVEAAKLGDLSNADVRFREVARLLEQGRPEEALAALQSLRDLLERKRLEGGDGGAAELQRQIDQASSSAAAISAELARLGRSIHAPVPLVAGEKLARQRTLAAASAAADADPAPAATAAILERADWPSRYDAVIRRYFGREP